MNEDQRRRRDMLLSGKEKGRLVSFVNHHFGPLKGLNVIIEGDALDSLDEYLNDQPLNLIEKIWGETLISTRAVELPMKFLKELEYLPPVLESLEAVEDEVMKKVDEGVLTGDPFYFRSFNL